MKHPRGISLIELLAVIATSVIIVGLVAGVIQTLFRASRAAEDHLVRDETITQLSESFRAYVRAATAAECFEENGVTRLELKLEHDRTVEFSCSEHEVIRIERAADKLQWNEKYALHAESAARFEIQSDEGAKRVSLVIVRQPGKSGKRTPSELRVEATLGRDHRFTSRRD